MSIADAVDRPDMAVAPLPAGGTRAKPRLTFGNLPDDVTAALRRWGDGSSATAVLVAMVRRLDAPRHAALRAGILADADEYAREQRRRR